MERVRSHSIASYVLILGTLFLLSSCSSRQESTSPPGLDGNEMYGVSDMEWVLENIAVFRTRTDLITPNRTAVEYLRGLKEPITLKIFMGSWSVTAQVHVPELFKALQLADNRYITVQVIGLNRRLLDVDGLAEIYDVTDTPTFIVVYKGRELGRIIETPAKDAATDVVSILHATMGR